MSAGATMSDLGMIADVDLETAPAERVKSSKSVADVPQQPPCWAFLDRISTKLPIWSWVLLLFICLMGLNMSWVMPSFLFYRSLGVAALNERPAGWIGCTNNATAGPVAARSTTPTGPMLTRFKGISNSNLNADLGEAAVALGQEVAIRFLPACPPVISDSNSAAFGRANTTDPYVKVVFTLTQITPESASARVDVRIEVVNSLDVEGSSYLNQTGGVVQVDTVPPVQQASMDVQWQDRTRSIPGITIPLATENPITNYPWDRYSINRIVNAELLLFNATAHRDVRKLPVQVWTQATTQQFNVFVEGTPGNKFDATEEIKNGENPVIAPNTPLRIVIERSGFTKSYAIVVNVILWLIGGLNLMHLLDNVFVRPRDLKDAFAASLLFGLPSFRNTMPGVPQAVGVAIDMIGLVWAELMVAICVLISFIAFLGQYKHTGPMFRRVPKSKTT